MKVVSVINYKGGVGKTSMTCNIAAELAYRGKRVLLIDLDAQASLTFSLITPDTWVSQFADTKTIKAWFDSHEQGKPIDLAGLIHRPKRLNERAGIGGRSGCVDLICSHLGLLNVDLELATKLGGASLAQAKKNFISVHNRLAEGIASLGEEYYDLIMIDCPPNFNIVTKTAIVASDSILIPARPDYLSTLGIDYLIRSVNQLVKEYNEFASVASDSVVTEIDPELLGVVFTMVQEYGSGPVAAQQTFIERQKRAGSIPVFENYVKRNDSLFADAPQYGVPVVLTHHSNQSHQSVVSGLEAVTTEFMSLVDL